MRIQIGVALHLLPLIFLCGVSHAQDATPTSAATAAPTLSADVIETEGISGDMDSKHRNPTVLTRTVVSQGNVKILVDAYVKDDEFKKYPMKFDFYINNQFYTSQVRSTEIPGPIGIDVGAKTATPPFNYTIVASILHPNRGYTTVVFGSAFTSNLVSTLDCTLSTNSGGTSSELIANSVESNQTSNNGFSLTFDATSADGSQTASVSASIDVSSGAATGSITVTQDGTPTTSSVTGTASTSSGKLGSVEVSASDESVSLVCS